MTNAHIESRTNRPDTTFQTDYSGLAHFPRTHQVAVNITWIKVSKRISERTLAVLDIHCHDISREILSRNRSRIIEVKNNFGKFKVSSLGEKKGFSFIRRWKSTVAKSYDSFHLSCAASASIDDPSISAAWFLNSFLTDLQSIV